MPIIQVDGNRPREIVFQEIDALLQKIRTDAVKFKTLEVTNGKYITYKATSKYYQSVAASSSEAIQ